MNGQYKATDYKVFTRCEQEERLWMACAREFPALTARASTRKDAERQVATMLEMMLGQMYGNGMDVPEPME